MGANSLYYGTEVGLEGKGDPDCRRTFPWEKIEEKQDVLGKIKEILAVKKHEAIKNGGIKIYSEGDLLILERFVNEKTLSLAINLGKEKNFDLGCKEILAAGNFKNQKLGENSFVIWEK